MGGCCSKGDVGNGGGLAWREEEGDDDFHEEEGSRRMIRHGGSCRYASMYSQQGWKGVNQDAMTIWEDFGGSKDEIFCGVFDGHGPLGHRVACHVRDVLPSKISTGLRSLEELEDDDGVANCSGDADKWLSAARKDVFVKAFEELDEELGHSSSIDCICSGSTAVSVVKQKEHLIIANLGDSRAVLGTRDDKNQLVPLQLTVDLKPNLPSEEERIKSCRGRVFALEEEPDVHRLWMPDEDCPGLAMARAFGDFCLKAFGLISTPQVTHRELSERDEFLVLATDGVWDVLSNKEVVKIVSSVSKRSEAAKHLVQRAVKAWRSKHSSSKVDDCAVVCLFLKHISSSSNVVGDNGDLSTLESFKTARSQSSNSEEMMAEETKEEWTALEGLSRVNSLLKLPRVARVFSWRKKSVSLDEEHKE
ncbi:hypothetical protein J5N97_002195 [Dioscorea zingiberensis]|uniref:protein-serine/threonine phosphatase n=1 Tax=Dioscorea zingiberensis TaxID=325984 RepID=A0A9D5HP51_9LILI|nr:hypothetical protein J5N97_002195 [Dioscorea zingiberensis]